MGICIGAAAVFLFTLVACCTCIARRKDKKKAKYANLKGADAIPLTAAGASKSQGRLAPQQSNASLASSHKGSYADPYASPEQEYSQQQAWTLGQRQQQQQPTYYPQQQQYMPQQGYAPQQQQQWGGQQQGYGGQQQGWQSQGRY